MNIKKTISHVMILVMLLTIIGCSNPSEQTSQSTADKDAVSNPQTDVPTNAADYDAPAEVLETKVSFQNTETDIELVGILFAPADLDESAQTPAILVGGPLASVKEQTQSIYARRMAEIGYIAMVFDYTYYGESGGEPRRLENPTMKDSDIKSAVTYLQSLPYVDEEKIAALGICGSGGQMTYTAASDSRIKAVATVVPYGFGMNSMPQMLTDEQRAELIAQRDAYEAGEAEPVYAGEYPVPYYTDPERGGIPEFDNIGTVTWSTLYFADYDLEAALKQLTTPLLIISPEESLSDTAEQMDAIVAGPKEYHFVEGSNHFDHYDLEPYVTDNVRLIEAFFKTHLLGESVAQPIPEQGAGKTLVAYISRTGTTQGVAEAIYDVVGGDIIKLETVNAYPEAYDDVLAQAKSELQEDIRPDIATEIKNMDEYDVIFIGHPIWHGTCPRAILTFLENYDLSGKTIIPFCTSGSSDNSVSMGEIREACSNATVLDGLWLNSSSSSTPQGAVTNWLIDLNILVASPVISSDEPERIEENENMLNLKIGDTTLTATLAENSSTAALKDMLAGGPLTIEMRDYDNMEKVGSFGADLPTNNEQITTEPGDLILFQGNAFVIYYAPNSWNFTRLGKINGVTTEKLKEVLGTGDVSVTLSLAQ